MGISSTLANIIGLVGTVLVVSAYAYSNVAKQINFVFFNLMNMAGAALLAISLTVHFNLASMLLEAVWFSIAVAGLIKAIRQRASP